MLIMFVARLIRYKRNVSCYEWGIMEQLNTLSAALAVLSAMIAPVVLISSCASLTISTSARLGRAIDRMRRMLERFEEVVRENGDIDESMMLYEQLHASTRRTKLLHNALTSLYISLSMFVASSVILGIVATTNENYAWIPLVVGMVGAVSLLYSGIMLITETQIARKAIHHEVDYVLERTKPYTPEILRQRQEALKREIEGSSE